MMHFSRYKMFNSNQKVGHFFISNNFYKLFSMILNTED